MKTIYILHPQCHSNDIHLSAPLYHTGIAIQPGIPSLCDIREAFLPKTQCSSFLEERRNWSMLNNHDTTSGWSVCSAPEVIFLVIVWQTSRDIAIIHRSWYRLKFRPFRRFVIFIPIRAVSRVRRYIPTFLQRVGLTNHDPRAIDPPPSTPPPSNCNPYDPISLP